VHKATCSSLLFFVMTKYISDIPICLDDCDHKRTHPGFPLSFKERRIKGGELSAGSIGPVPSEAYFSVCGTKSQVHLRYHLQEVLPNSRFAGCMICIWYLHSLLFFHLTNSILFLNINCPNEGFLLSLIYEVMHGHIRQML
jgi:hypothetical protein